MENTNNPIKATKTGVTYEDGTKAPWSELVALDGHYIDILDTIQDILFEIAHRQNARQFRDMSEAQEDALSERAERYTAAIAEEYVGEFLR